MKLLIVTQYFWPENFRINDLAFELASKRHDVTVLTGIPNYPEGKYYNGYTVLKNRKQIYKNVKIVRTLLFPRGKNNKLLLVLNYLSFVIFGSLSALFLVTKRFDKVFVYGLSPITLCIPAIVYKIKHKIPIFMWIQDLWPESIVYAGNIQSKLIYNATLRLVKYIYKKCDLLLIQSKAFQKSIEEKDVKSDKIIYVPNWAESVFSIEKADKEKYKSLFIDGFNIVFAGNIGEAQDFEAIVEAALLLNKSNKINFVIIGDGRKKEWLSAKIKEYNLTNIKLVDRFPLEEMPHLYIHADALLVSLKKSIIFSMTIPGKVQSYMAFGKPILTMLSGEGSSIVKEADAGLIADSGDFQKLASNILQIQSMSKEHRNMMGENAKKYYEIHFNREKLINKIELMLIQNNQENI